MHWYDNNCKEVGRVVRYWVLFQKLTATILLQAKAISAPSEKTEKYRAEVSEYGRAL